MAGDETIRTDHPVQDLGSFRWFPKDLIGASAGSPIFGSEPSPIDNGCVCRDPSRQRPHPHPGIESLLKKLLLGKGARWLEFGRDSSAGSGQGFLSSQATIYMRLPVFIDAAIGWLLERVRGFENIAAVALRLTALDSAQTLNDLSIPPGNRLESLPGEGLSQHSILKKRSRPLFQKSPVDS